MDAGIIDRLLSYIRGDPAVMRTEPGQTYGPAVSRITRTPITFAPGANKGEYDPATKTISIDPTKTTDLGATTRHESIHALLDQVPAAPQIAANSAGYGDIQKFFSGGMGNPRDEAPAYLGAGGAQFMGLSDTLRKAFLDDFQERLGGASPQAAQTFQRVRR